MSLNHNFFWTEISRFSAARLSRPVIFANWSGLVATSSVVVPIPEFKIKLIIGSVVPSSIRTSLRVATLSTVVVGGVTPGISASIFSSSDSTVDSLSAVSSGSSRGPLYLTIKEGRKNTTPKMKDKMRKGIRNMLLISIPTIVLFGPGPTNPEVIPSDNRCVQDSPEISVPKNNQNGLNSPNPPAS